MNIIFSTTRQWNPGDEFILMGVINLLKKYFKEEEKYFNPIIYNRNPQIRRARKRDIIKGIDNIIGKDFLEKFRDNSVKDRQEMNYADLVVFAGSPEWCGRRLKKLYSSILDYNIPTILLGIGTDSKEPLQFDNNSFTKSEINVYKNLTKLVVCRDKNTYAAFKDFDFSAQLPCPAFFSSKEFKEIKEVKKIGLIYSTNNAEGGNDVSSETHKYLLNLYNNILEKYKNKYQFEFIAHYIDEIPEFQKDFSNQKIHYSYDSKDYLDIYSSFDFVIGCRVHGLGICASMGIPGIMIAHDQRSETVKGFLAQAIKVNEPFDKVVDVLENSIDNIILLNDKLKLHKQDTLEKYLELFKNNMGN
ncbi:MAG: polysaccharide pyruvyl transferase family protein [Campylobacterota bacterium]|nr:polysaccharide pyruvyl transferase family protein [Campylobacterota bacterium]